MQTKLPYLMQNRFQIFLLRFSFPNHTVGKTRTNLVRVQEKPPRLTYRQVVCSLRTKDWQQAISLYFSVIDSAKALFNQVVNEQYDMNNNQQVEAMEVFKERLNQLIDMKDNPPKPRWLADIQRRKFLNDIEQLMSVEAKENSLSRNMLAMMETKFGEISATLSKAPNSDCTGAGRLLIDEVADYIDYKKSGWASRTAGQSIANLYRFAEIVGEDKDVSELTGDDMLAYLSVMMSSPRNAATRKPDDFASYTPDDKKSFWATLSESTSSNKLTLGGVAKHVSDIRGLLTRLYMLKRTERDLKPFLAMDKKSIKKTSKRVGAYSEDELYAIFNSYIYSSGLRLKEKPKPFHFWLPLIALTTGMRAGEVAALEVSDVVVVDGIKCFDLNDQWQDKSLKKSLIQKSKKNESSSRLIPIPAIIWNAGFDTLIGSRKSGLLFEELRNSFCMSLSKEMSKWYLDYFMKYAGISKTNSKAERLTLHSLRHTFVTKIHSSYVDYAPVKSEVADYITGHTDGSVRKKVYMHGYDMNYVQKCIDSIDFGVDLSSLSYSKFLKRS